MKFILTDSPDDGVRALADRLINELGNGRRVLWLTSGGSNIEASVHAMGQITDDLTAGLTVMPNDERYGEVGHADSNWAQLMAAGFEAKQAKLIPVLHGGLSFEETVTSYAALAEKAFADNDTIIFQHGMGADGHISGILPGSPAAKETKALVIGYQSPPYSRLTMTFPALLKATVAYLFAFGAAKRPALENLQSGALPLEQQPAQVLKKLTEAYVYNDQVGENA